MQVSRSPMARWISSAATVESTPPDKPQTTLPVSPTWVRMRAVASSMKEAIVQSPVQPQTSKANRRRISAPCSVCTTSGWNSRPYSARSGASIATIGALELVAASRKPGGTAATSSPWLAHTRKACGRPSNSRGVAPSSSTCTCAWPNSRWPERRTFPPSMSVSSCMP